MKKILILSFLILLVCGCSNEKCIKSHEVDSTCMYYSYVIIGGQTMLIPNYYPCKKTVCDEYEKNEA